MIKGDHLKIIFALAVIGLFILQYAGMGLNPPEGGEQGETPTQYVGTSVVSATIEYYERFLYTQSLSFEQMEEIKKIEGVTNVESEEDIYKISLERKEDVVLVYNKLKEMEIESYATAKVTLEPSVTMYDEQKNPVTGYFYNRKVKIDAITPIFPPGSIVQLKSEIVIQEEQAFQNGAIELYSEGKEIEAGAFVLSKKHYYEFIVPWGQRNEVELEILQGEYGEENVEYEKNNKIMFIVPLSVQEQIDKKFKYINYISANLAIINEDYNNSEQIMNDFGENVNFTNSLLSINGENIELNYEFTDFSEYEVKLNLTDEYVLSDELTVQNVKYEGELEEGAEINVNISSYVTGNNILSIEEVSILE